MVHLFKPGKKHIKLNISGQTAREDTNFHKILGGGENEVLFAAGNREHEVYCSGKLFNMLHTSPC